MYLSFYKLRENPFTLVSDPRFLYYSESHCEALAHLLYGVRERKGIILMLGEAGTGKTTLVSATLDLLRSTRVSSSVIMNPIFSSAEELLDAVLRGFNVAGYKVSTVSMLDVLQRFLRQHVDRGRIPVLVIDEGQSLSHEILEQVRMLSNLEYRGAKLLQFVLAGQPELHERINSYEYRALRQRIVVRCRLASLTPDQTWQYIQTRLVRAGWVGEKPLFSPAAVEHIYTYSGGTPRVINMLCDNALLAAYAKSSPVVSPEIVSRVAEHLELSPADVANTSVVSVHEDILRASSSWGEVVRDLQSANVPEALRTYVESLRAPELPAAVGGAIIAHAHGGGQ